MKEIVFTNGRKVNFYFLLKSKNRKYMLQFKCKKAGISMSEIIKGVNVLLPSGYQALDVVIEDGKFKDFLPSNVPSPKHKIIPGFVDIHTHGANGLDFSTVKNVDEILSLLDFYASKGTTSLLPTLLTEKDEVIYRQMELIYEASKINPMIKGIHLEGPFLSKVYKGAQLEECLQLPTVEKAEKFLQKSHGLFKYMTIAPELEGSKETIEYMVSKGIRVSCGHSDASFDDTYMAYKAGARSITHTMNAMKGLHQHFPSILSAALYIDDMYNEVILDGIHVVPEMVEFIRKIKGNDKVIGITDSLMAAGLPDGNYFIGETPITVKDHDCKITSTGVRAGSTLTMDRAFRNIKKFCSLSDLEASKMTSYNASKMLGIDTLVGSIEKNKDADFILLDENDEIKEVYINGRKH